MKEAIYRYGKTELMEGSQIPRDAIVEFLGMATKCRKQKKYAIRYNGRVFFTSYGKLDFRKKNKLLQKFKPLLLSDFLPSQEEQKKAGGSEVSPP